MENNEKTISQEEKTKLVETVKELVDRMGFEVEIEMQNFLGEERESLVCNIKTEESSFLIGQYGANLKALQHIARLLARKKVSDSVNFILDVNSYRQEKNDSIVKVAKDLAQQAVLEKRAITLHPMSPYERRLVHLELSRDERIRTESIGEGENRRVIIKPADLI